MRLRVLAGPLLAALVAGPVAAQTDRPAATVVARGETVPVGTANDDAADDPAIWRNSRNPQRSWIVATDKKAGLHVYALDGQSRHFVAAGRVNNVDLIDLGRRGVIVVASDRNDNANAVLLVYRLETATGRLTEIGRASGGAGEAYGVCLMADRGQLHAFSVLKQGTIHQVRLDLGRAGVESRIIRTMQLQTQTEGCVADPRTRTLYVGEEDVGIWRFDARAGAPVAGTLVAPVDGKQLVADVEGLALAPQGGRGGFLVASSQGDNAYALYRLPGLTPAGRFRIASGRFGSVEETDGIALVLGGFGPSYAGGLFVAQDGENAPAAQNFKLVAWRDVMRALRRR